MNGVVHSTPMESQGDTNNVAVVSDSTPVVGGEVNNQHGITPIDSRYISEDYCISCAYWVQNKGHFGACKISPDKIYDGSKKGSSCVVWRIKTGLELKSGKQANIPDIKSIVSVYNKKARADYMMIRYNVDMNNLTFADKMITLPTDSTTVLRKIRRYFKKRYNYTIIDTVLKEHLKGKTYEEICKLLDSYRFKVPSRRAIREWIVGILGAEAYGYTEIIGYCNCGGQLIRNGHNMGNVERFKCKKCGKYHRGRKG